jgi:hypothetical protein
VIGNSMSYPGEALDVTGFDEGFYDWNAGKVSFIFSVCGSSEQGAR